MMRSKIAELVSKAQKSAVCNGILSTSDANIVIGISANLQHGDFSCNIAMQLSKPEKKSPRQIAEIIISSIEDTDSIIEKTEIAGPGFINFFVSKSAWLKLLLEIEAAGEKFGRSDVGGGRKVQVEFVSANPTGPLHIGHGRGAAIGDTLSRILKATGWDVTREFYYNDAGQQINNLAQSVWARCLNIEPDDPRWPQDGYQGEYIKDVAKAYLSAETVDCDDRHIKGEGDPENIEAIRKFAVAYLRREQDADLKAFDVSFDVFTLESKLYEDGKVEEVVKKLTENGYVYEQDGALWLRTTDFGDDKDRVMRKKDGGYTYFVPDVAYHLQKWERGFERVINEQGGDHHSTVTRVRAGLQALDCGIPKSYPEYLLHQMVTVMRGGEEVKISKRAGSYVTLRDLIEEVGKDATRYFFIMRKADSQLVFDIDLAKESSPDNPVYYVQYAYARICSIFENAKDRGFTIPSKPELKKISRLETDEEMEIAKLISLLPRYVADAAQNLEPHIITNYLASLASSLHTFYNKNRVITEDNELTEARLYLLARLLQALKNSLDIIGINALERM